MHAKPALRHATRADVPALVALVESAYRGDASRAGWTTEADLLDGQRTDAAAVGALIGHAGSVVLVLEGATGILACAHLARHGDHAVFGMFAVRPTLQRAGLGRAVLAGAEREARDAWRAAALRLCVIDARAELIAWYERRGYHLTGEHSPFPYGDTRFGQPRRGDLRFAWLEKFLSEEIR